MSSYTFKYGLTAVLLVLAFSLSAADKKKEPAKVYPLYQGINVGVELSQPVFGAFSGTHGYSAKVDVNLKNAYFPTLELGYTSFDKTAESGIHCLAAGPFFKIGVNKSLTFLGDKAENMFFAGIHYGLSSFTYSLDNLSWYDNYWGNTTTSYLNQPGLAGWLELMVGVRVNFWGPFSLGWTGQYKSTLHVSGGAQSDPAYIPGYGENLKPQTGLAIHLYYHLPF
jgi:hypothetical protein